MYLIDWTDLDLLSIVCLQVTLGVAMCNCSHRNQLEELIQSEASNCFSARFYISPPCQTFPCSIQEVRGLFPRVQLYRYRVEFWTQLFYIYTAQFITRSTSSCLVSLLLACFLS
ncbi:hypothetical protein F5B19DRAFT_17038 [Rostrohypoxylon terebratum]|nr:hypothetical protein F5B19DRAFT_17038 [Rostrohypoxylon terebratum]